MTVKSDKRSILTNVDAEKNHSPLLTTNWRSIYIASALSFIGSAQFSLYFSSLWPYLQIIDRSITESFFGYIIAIYSLGQIFASPLFGYWSNRLGRVAPLLFVGLFMMFVGNATYLALEIFTFPKRYLLLVGRFITGAGSGNVILLRTYASTASTSHERSKAIAFVTCGQAIGLTSGPALQLLFTSLHYPGVRVFGLGHLHLNLYTAPAYLACAMNFLGAVVLYFFFREDYAGLMESSLIKVDENNAQAEQTSEENDEKTRQKSEGLKSVSSMGSGTSVKVPSSDKIAVLVCLLTRFTYMFINTNLETIGSPYSMMMFAWTESKTVFYTSLAQGAIGLLTFGIYVAWITLRLERFLKFRLSCMGALVILMVFHLVTYSWSFIPGQVPIQSNNTHWALETIDSEAEPVGCDAQRFEWCETLAPVNVWLYYVSYVLALGLAFPILNITNTTLYADVLGPRRQGTQQGILQISGGSARLIGPIIMSALYSAYGPTMAWKMEILIILLTLLPWLLFYRRMIPLLKRHRLRAIGAQSISRANSPSPPPPPHVLTKSELVVDDVVCPKASSASSATAESCTETTISDRDSPPPPPASPKTLSSADVKERF